MRGELNLHDVYEHDVVYLLENAVFLFDIDIEVQILVDRAAEEIVRLRRVADNAKRWLPSSVRDEVLNGE